MIVLAFARGAWLDEVWTLWLVRHDLPVAELYRQRWSFEPHPPIFYAYEWWLGSWLPVSVPLLRLGNLAGLLAFGLAASIARRRGASPAALIVYALLVFGSPVIVIYFAELRSYFLQVSVLAGLVLLLERVHFADRDFGPGRDAGLTLAIVVWIVLGAWMHYLNGAFCFTVAGVEALNQFRRRRFGWGAVLSVAVLLGCLSLVPPLRHYLSLGPVSSPMVVSPLKGYGTAAGLMAIGIGANLAALGFAVAAVRDGQAGGRAASGFTYALVLAIVAIIVAFAFTTLNDMKSFLVPRYVLGLVPLLAAPVAHLAAARFDARLFWLVPANAAMLAFGAMVLQAGNKRWEKNIPLIQAEAARCPATQIVPLDPFTLAHDKDIIPKASTDPEATMQSIMRNGYAYLADRHGFALRFPNADRPISPRGCPVIVWIESNYFRSDPTADDVLRQANVSLDPHVTGARRIIVDGDHVLVIAQPAAR